MSNRLDQALGRRLGGFTLAEWLPSVVLIVRTLQELPHLPAYRVQGPRVAVEVLALAGAGALVLRQRRPMMVLLWVLGCLTLPALLWGTTETSSGVLLLVVALFAAGRYGQRPLAYLAPVLGVGVALVLASRDPLETVSATWKWSLNALWVFGLGVWLRQKSELDAAGRAEIEARALTHAAEERVQIARDLHDVLAHNLAVMVLQAEVADVLLDQDPVRARTALGNVQATGRHALQDVRGLLAALRGGDRTAAQEAPGLEGLGPLVDTLRESGLPVTLTVLGAVDRVPAAHASVVYRAVQEALTNTVRHAGHVATSVAVTVDGEVRVEVQDQGRSSAVPAVGHGLAGMRERAEALGGSVAAGPVRGRGFVVRMVLPLDVAS